MTVRPPAWSPMPADRPHPWLRPPRGVLSAAIWHTGRLLAALVSVAAEWLDGRRGRG